MSQSKQIGFHVELKTYRNKVYATSLHVADDFEKQHKNVLRDIEKLIGQLNQLSFDDNNGGLNFELSNYFNKLAYIDKQGFSRPMYDITRKGYELLVMGFTGEKALKWKLAYQNRFEEMEAALIQIAANKANTNWSQLRLFGKQEHHEFTDAVKAVYELAHTQGSTTDQDKFQMSYAKMIKVALGFIDRNLLMGTELERVIRAERQAADIIHQDVASGTPYKDIYQHAKAKVITYADVLNN
jgi:Rha family phage regulatory protein